MLTKKTPATIKADLSFSGQGVENNILLTYHNRSKADFDGFVKNPENMKVPDSAEQLSDTAQIAYMNAALVLFLVKSFDDGTDDAFPLTLAGLVELEEYWPGVLLGLVRGYHQARGGSVEKN